MDNTAEVVAALNNASIISGAPIIQHSNGYVPRLSIACSPWQIVVSILVILITYDQLMYIWRKGSIAGPRFKLPFMGPFLQALDPKFDSYLAQWASGALSCVSVFHKFVVLVSDRDLARKAFNSPAHLKPCIVPVAESIIGPSAWVFLDGKRHADFRKGLNGLFTRKALECYLPTQEKVWSTYFDRFVSTSKSNKGEPMPFMGEFREINCALSCRTFVGNYISDDAVKRIADDYYCITAALELVNVPLSIHIPYTKVWLGKRAADGVLKEFEQCAASAKANMAAGNSPTCIIDRWIISMMESKAYEAKVVSSDIGSEKPAVLIREFSNDEIARTMFTFLFASQDASSSATTWLFQITAQRPDILDKIRKENIAARNGDRSGSLTLDKLESMTYTNAVVRETLRYRPPVIFVPYSAKKAFNITPTYTVPKGAMVVPSCYPALHDPEVYSQPDDFLPERWITGDAMEMSKNWLVFGAGPHNCIAQQYVQLTMTAMIGMASLVVDWKHHATARSEEIKVFATLFPMDDCPMVFTKRS